MDETDLIWALIAMFGYLLGAMLLAALAVRTMPKSDLGKFYQRHFILFPFSPLAVLLAVTSVALKTAGKLLGESTRYLFQALSGKRIKRRKTGPWY